MEDAEHEAPSVDVPDEGPDAMVPGEAGSPAPTAGGQCSQCGGAQNGAPNGGVEPTYVYALGRVKPRFPSLSLEKEFSQATARTDTADQTDQMALSRVLNDPANRYIVREMCWVLSVAEIETYLLRPAYPEDLSRLTQAVRPSTTCSDLDLVVGMRGPVAPPDLCGGLSLPIVAFTQLYSFDVASLVQEVAAAGQTEGGRNVASSADELLCRILELADNAGATDEHRALNYLAVRYPDIYHKTAELHGQECSLAGVEVVPSRLSGARNIVTVVFAYRNRRTDVEQKWSCRVDVTEQFPFLVTKLREYYDR